MTDQPRLAKRFSPLSSYRRVQADSAYTLLPFNFSRLDHRYLISNDAGEYFVLERDQLEDLVRHRLDPESELYGSLRSKHFLYDSLSDSAIDLLALKVRTRHAPIKEFTSLHIFVVSLRCDYTCKYCQVSRQTTDKQSYDMDEDTAKQALELTFKSPASSLKIEFQGGEPLLNFPVIRYIVQEAERINETHGKQLEFVIATNLTYIEQEGILNFCERHGVLISTSLDGPVDLHNANRPRSNKDGYQRTINGINAVRQRLGPDSVAALMTTTERSLERPIDIVDSYIDAGFQSIFLRPISPYGFAIKTRQAQKYDFARFFKFYEQAMDYILELNMSGVPFVEQYSSLVLKKLVSPYPTGYVDLQSPAGAGVSAIVFNYDGGVYASDEARMLAEMGDKTFLLGNVRESSYEDIFLNETLLTYLEESLAQSAPECSECAFLPFCGSDPTYHYATQRDWVGHKEHSAFCQRTKSITGYLIRKLEDNPSHREILLDWAR